MIPRDWFAGLAMKSIMDQGSLHGFDNPSIAGMAYRMADAMMEEREKQAKVPQSGYGPGFDAFDGMGYDLN